MSALTPQQVIEAFARYTEIRFRVVPPSVQRQAMEFVKFGFTLRELELVAQWTRRQIARGQGGYNAASLQWRTLFGAHGAADQWVCFQERLGLAETDLKRGWRPKLETGAGAEDKQAMRKGDQEKPATPATISAPEEERLREQRRVEMEKLKNQLNRK